MPEREFLKKWIEQIDENNKTQFKAIRGELKNMRDEQKVNTQFRWKLIGVVAGVTGGGAYAIPQILSKLF